MCTCLCVLLFVCCAHVQLCAVCTCMRVCGGASLTGGAEHCIVINKTDFSIPSRPGRAASRPKVMHFSCPWGKVNVVYKPLWLKGAGQWWQLKPAVLQMEGGDRSTTSSPGFSKGEKNGVPPVS